MLLLTQTPPCRQLINKAKLNAERLLEKYIEAEPRLRAGTYGNALEEYAEAVLFLAWLENKRVLSKEEVGMVNTQEYLGGVLDLTGEVGRYAVAKATKRNRAAVEQCLHVDYAIQRAVSEITNMPGGGALKKKLGPLKQAVSKLEAICYELAILETGKSKAGSSLKGDAQPAAESSEA